MEKLGKPFCLQKTQQSENFQYFVKTGERSIINHLGVSDKRQTSVTVPEKCEN